MKNGEENVRSNRRRSEKKDQTQQENRFETCVLEKEKGKNLNKKYTIKYRNGGGSSGVLNNRTTTSTTVLQSSD